VRYELPTPNSKISFNDAPEFNNLDAQRLTGLQCVDRDAALAFALAVVGEGE
jgi:hypothetical protein